MTSPSSVESFRSDYVEFLRDQRLDICVEAKLELSDGSRMMGKTKNLSYRGAFIELQNLVTAITGEDCVLALVIHEKPEPDILTLRCNIKHINQKGIGVQIIAKESGDLDGFVHLLAANSSDPEGMAAVLMDSYRIEMLCNDAI